MRRNKISFALRGEGGRLRSGWRLLLFTILFVGLSGLASLGLKWLIGKPPADPALKNLFLVGLAGAVATLAVFLCRRYLDRRSFVSLGLRTGWSALGEACFGFLLSGALISVAFLGLLGLGWVTVQRGEPVATVVEAAIRFSLWLLGAGVIAGWWEELVFRGYLLQNLRDGVGLTAALVLTSMMFGALHLLNPHATAASAIVIAFIGFYHAYAWLRTGRLWMAMGTHAGWNVFQGPVFGFQVSGRETFSWLRSQSTGPEWATGGAFGPEAGITPIVAVVLGLAAIYFWTRARHPDPRGQTQSNAR